MGFGDNNLAIRELTRFIEMTSREFIFEEPPTTNIDGFKLKIGLNSFIYRN